MSDTVQTNRMRNAMLAMGWDYPFFLPVLGYCTIEESDAVRTAAINVEGRILLNPTFAASLDDRMLGGIGFHELGHVMLSHHTRENGRNRAKYGRACDRAWNQALREMGVQLPPGALYPTQESHKLYTVEQLYDIEGDRPEDNDPSYEPGAGEGCSPDPGGVPEGMTAGELERQWAEVAVQSKALAAGTKHADVMARAMNIPRPRVGLEQILRNAASHALSNHGRDDQTWLRRSRRSPPNGFLPGWTATKAVVAIVIDSSGSVDDSDLAVAVSISMRLAQLSGLRVYLALHDSDCYYSGWVNVRGSESITRKLTGRGGTSFTEAYEAVAGAGRIDVMVHATDGECYHWPDKPTNVRKLVVAQLGSCEHIRPPVGTQVIQAEV